MLMSMMEQYLKSMIGTEKSNDPLTPISRVVTVTFSNRFPGFLPFLCSVI